MLPHESEKSSNKEAMFIGGEDVLFGEENSFLWWSIDCQRFKTVWLDAFGGVLSASFYGYFFFIETGIVFVS